MSAPLQGVVGEQSLTAAALTAPDTMLEESATSSRPSESAGLPGSESARPPVATPAGDHLAGLGDLLGSEWPRRILFVGSSGGHLAQLAQLRPWWQDRDRRWVTFPGRDVESLLAGEDVVTCYSPTTRNAKNAVRNLGLAVQVLRNYRPDVVVSAGAGVAVPFFVTARALGVRTVYLEVYDRIDLPTMTGKLCYPFTDLFLLQWEEQRTSYPKGRVIGSLY